MHINKYFYYFNNKCNNKCNIFARDQDFQINIVTPRLTQVITGLMLLTHIFQISVSKRSKQVNGKGF